MKAAFSREELAKRRRLTMRFFEVLPGLMSWSIILGMFALSCLRPLAAALLIIAFVLSWLIRLLYATFFLTASYMRLSAESGTDWMARVEKMGNLDAHREELRRLGRRLTFGERLSNRAYRREIEALSRSGKPPPRLEEINHLVIFPIVRENRDIFEPGVRSIVQGRFPCRRILLILAVEERAPETVKRDAEKVRKAYRKYFLDLVVAVHPDGVPGEARVKGANTTYAARKAAGYYRSLGVPFDNVVVSCFDSDTIVTPEYFACLTYNYMVCPERTRASFQPVPMYHNNMWEASGFARILGIGSSFFQLLESTNPEKLVTFSSHSMSFKALSDVGYWPVDMISDDSAIYWKSFLHYKGDYRVVPMYITLSMDLAEGETWWKTVINVYRQQRRWAWGAESIPIVMTNFLASGEIPLRLKIKHGYKLVQTHVSWATWPFMLAVINWLPLLFVGGHYPHSLVVYNAPRILSTMFRLAFLGFVVYALFSQLSLPRKRAETSPLRRIGFALEWLLLPVVSIIFGAAPALDAQTRLMLGKRMEFWVTVKKRRKPVNP